MRVAFIGRGSSKEYVTSLLQGFQRGGWEVTYETYRLFHNSLIVFNGLCKEHDSIRAIATRYNIPWAVIDLGLVRDLPEVQYQLCLNGFGKLPDVAFGDRFSKWNLPILEYTPRNHGPVLIVGQVPGDTQHHMSEAQIVQWYVNQAKTLRSQGIHNFYLRKHPKATCIDASSLIRNKIETVSADKPFRKVVSEVMGFVTYNSSAMYEAIMAGVPFVCDKSASYKEFSSPSLVEPYVASYSKRKTFMDRVAYSQWSLYELANGTFLPYLMQQIENEKSKI